MKIFHDSRDIAYRAPYGAVTPGADVTLTVDVLDAPNANVKLRTWLDGEGERLYDMSAVDADPETLGDPEEGDGQWHRASRYQVTLTLGTAGIVWYHFIVTDEQGNTKRYGATPGRVGGTGQMADWEPPSFQITVHQVRDMPPAWHEVIGAYLYNQGAVRTLDEIIETVRENFPYAAYETAYPWCSSFAEDALGFADGSLHASGGITPSEKQENSDADLPAPCFAANDEVFGFWSTDDAGNVLCTLVNTSLHTGHDIAVALAADEVTELVCGYGVRVVNEDDLATLGYDGPVIAYSCEDASPAGRCAYAHLNPLSTCVLHFHATERLQRPMDPAFGVLAHITSLPAEGEGTLGEPAKRFVDWLAQAGVRYWQVLPVNPTDEFGSPYAGISAFAGNIRMLEGNSGSFADPSPTPRAYAKVAKLKKYQAFCERERDWLEPYAAFMAIRQKLGTDLTWQEWPKRYRRYNAKLIAGDEELKQTAEAWRQSQYLFEQQWNELRAYANERGVLIVGDMPIYVSGDSADVWAHPDIFQLDKDGMPLAVAGCAPDAFAPDGQVWGNPLYDWDACRASGYDWWLRRLKRAFALYDAVRLDHFIGFSRYFSIPAATDEEEADAKLGTYRRGPGIELFQRAFEQFGPLPVIAEDLGLITPAVRALSDSCGFPGMDIAQFVDGNDPLSGYQPRPGKIAYTGTHDNQTLAGYCQQRYPHLDACEAARSIMEKVAACNAPVCIMPLQDLMGLDDSARMNTPGTTEGNWSWQADADDLPAALELTRELVALHERQAAR